VRACVRAVPNMAAFCSCMSPCLPGMWLSYFLSYFQMVPIAPLVAGNAFVFAFHILCISVVRSLYFRIFSASFLNTFLPPHTATSVNMHVPFFISTYHDVPFVFRYGCVGSHLLIPQYGWLPYVQDLFRLISVHAHTSVHCLITPIFLRMLRCSSAHTVS